MLHAVEQDVQVKCSDVVANQDIRIELLQLRKKARQQRTLVAMHLQHASTVALPLWAGVLATNQLLKPWSTKAR